MKKILLVLIIPFVLMACSDSTGPAIPSMAGTWQGTSEGLTLRMTLNQSETGAVSGNGTLSGSDMSIALTVSGTHNHPNVSLTGQASGYSDMNYSGHFQSDNLVAGSISGSGFNNFTLNLNRQ